MITLQGKGDRLDEVMSTDMPEARFPHLPWPANSKTSLPNQATVERAVPHAWAVAALESVCRRSHLLDEKCERAYQALRESEACFRSLIERAPEAVLVFDCDANRLVEANPKAEQLFACSRDELLRAEPQHFYSWHSVCQSFLGHRQSVLARGEVVFELPVQNADRENMQCEVRLVALPSADRRLLRASFVDITERKRTESALRSRTEQLRALAASLQKVREEERAKVARDLHDQIGQALTALKLDLSRVAQNISGEQRETADRIREMLDLTSDALMWLRGICTELRPGVLDDLGLEAAIEWQAKEFAARTGVRCEVSVPAEDLVLASDVATAIFRIFQEALTNVARHAEATLVHVSLRKQPTTLLLEVKDDGKGFRTEDLAGSASFLGLLGMRERAFVFDGDVVISSAPGAGTTVTATIPLQPTAGDKEG